MKQKLLIGLLVTGIGLLTLGVGGRFAGWDRRARTAARLKELAEIASKDRFGIKGSDARDRMREFALEGDFDTLAAVHQQDSMNSGYAVFLSSFHRKSGRESVTYCKQFEVGSYYWSEAFEGLRGHPREEVIDYVNLIAESPDSYVRGHVYRTCERAGWPDVIDRAIKDLHCEDRAAPFSLLAPGAWLCRPLFLPGGEEVDYRLCRVAKDYIRAIDKDALPTAEQCEDPLPTRQPPANREAQSGPVCD
jgi:hypothetical protein